MYNQNDSDRPMLGKPQVVHQSVKFLSGCAERDSSVALSSKAIFVNVSPKRPHP